jgi:hypothetical protein
VFTRSAYLLVAITTLSGCAGVSTFGRARPLPKGATEIAVEPALVTGSVLPPSAGAGLPVAPQLGVSVRHGAATGLEIGARVHALGLSAAQKTLVFSNERRTRVISIATTFGAMNLQTSPGSNDAFIVLPMEIGVLGGITATERVEVTLAARSLGQTWLGIGAGSTGSHATMLWLGGSLALPIRVTRRFSILPEIAAFGHAMNINNVGSGLGDRVLGQATIALVWNLGPTR